MKKLALFFFPWVAIHALWGSSIAANVCPLPHPNQVVIYQNAARGDPCKVLKSATGVARARASFTQRPLISRQ